MADLSLTHLTWTGSGLPTAQVTFGPALTIICGNSDTGKTFIVNSIDYMLGGRRSTPSITHAAGYSQILLGLKLPDDSPLTLVRKPGSNHIHVHRADLRDLTHATPDAVVSARRAKRDISNYLLEVLGLNAMYIRTNEQGSTAPLQLPDIAHLAVVTDGRIDDETPPCQRGRGQSSRTAGRSVMRLSLTGDDEPPANLSNAAQRRVQRGKITLIDQLVVDLTSKIITPGNTEALRRLLTRLDTSVREATTSHHAESERQTTAIAARTRLNEDEARLTARLNEISDLLGRFDLLQQQYESDLDRLAMVGEAGNLLGYFQTGRCVFCGAEAEHQTPHHGLTETTQLHQAVQAEDHKTRALLADLRLTITDLDEQRAELAGEIAEIRDQDTSMEAVIADIARRLEPLNEVLEHLLEQRAVVQRDLELLARIEELDERRVALAGEAAPARRAPSYIPASVQDSFNAELQAILDDWHVPGVEAATWDPYSGEVRAGGSDRSSRGRGLRALLHAAFSTALAQYCCEHRMPHMGFLVLDSPLVTFGQLEPGDERVPLYVKDYFYRHFLRFPVQRIIVENSVPPDDVIEQAHVVFFGTRGQGRPGFFPDRHRTPR
ncbi:ATP-binding protein [Streptomyces nigrescens]|uniref:ATP-binding protein n=1 Tax=Streptomyces nigrescens TaxID=1920 RepID=UPI0038065199